MSNEKEPPMTNTAKPNRVFLQFLPGFILDVSNVTWDGHIMKGYVQNGGYNVVLNTETNQATIPQAPNNPEPARNVSIVYEGNPPREHDRGTKSSIGWVHDHLASKTKARKAEYEEAALA